MTPTHAMVLAAGLGLRLRPLTETTPKPLVPVAGRTLLDRALDRLAAAGVTEAVVNVHYLAHMIEAHLADRAIPAITLSRETDTLLETGGGVKKALAQLGHGPFYVVNADIAWEDGPTPALRRLADAWDDTAMDALLLLNPLETATGYDGVGDYAIDADGRLRRRGDEADAPPAAPYVFTGIQLLHPRLFDGSPDGPFSLALLYDRAQAAGRLSGLVHDGDWHHIGTMAGLDVAERRLAAASPGGG